MGTILKPGPDGFYHPATEGELIALIKEARKQGQKIRVRGSGHSVGRAIFTDNFRQPQGQEDGFDLMLDQLSFDAKNPDDKVKIDKAKLVVHVKAGCHLGRDPYDPAGVSSVHNSLFYQLDQAGLAVPDMGGIIHQAVGGFIATGSSGGSLSDSFGEQIVAMTLIDGTGKMHKLTRESGDDLFFAAGVSMGLLGIITEVTFKLVKKFHVKGEQVTTGVNESPIDLFGNGGAGKPSLKQFLYDTPYTRLMWWPQQKVERMVIWKAHKMQPQEYNEQTGTPDDFKPNPYLEFPMFGKMNFQSGGFRRPDIPSEGPSEKLAEGGGGLFYSIVGNWHQAIAALKPSFLVKLALKFVGWLYPKHILPAVLNQFVPLGRVEFWDSWWHGLPMDNRVDDKLVPTDFTEIWIPISRTAEVMQKLRDHYKKNGLAATGSYSCELYAAKKSDFWLSPSYGEDMFRVDVFWYGYNAEDPQTVYYPQFWDLLMPAFPCRFHWGKYMPAPPQYPHAPAYFAQQYPKWNDFMKVRAQLDPDGIFLNTYWKKRLAL